MYHPKSWFLITFLIVGAICSSQASTDSILWKFDDLHSIGGHKTTILGNPSIIESPYGQAIEFDGVDDAIFLDLHPLEGLQEFTVELIFKPYASGPTQQRFFHMQENASDSRVMFETRLVENEQWFLDCFIKSDENRVALYAEEFPHTIGPWYHAALTVDGKTFEHFVNGKKELSEQLDYKVQLSGKTSIGVRINKIDWFKGAVLAVKFTPHVIHPDEFMTIENLSGCIKVDPSHSEE